MKSGLRDTTDSVNIHPSAIAYCCRGPSTVIGTVVGIYEARPKYRREVAWNAAEQKEEEERDLVRGTYTMSLCRRCVPGHHNYQRARTQDRRSPFT